LNQDPIKEGGGINLYRFVVNNSINWVDLLGLQGWINIVPNSVTTNTGNPNYDFLNPSTNNGIPWSDMKQPRIPIGSPVVPQPTPQPDPEANAYIPDIHPTQLGQDIANQMSQIQCQSQKNSPLVNQGQKMINAWANAFQPGPTDPSLATYGFACEALGSGSSPYAPFGNIGAPFFEQMQDNPNTTPIIPALLNALDKGGQQNQNNFEDKLNDPETWGIKLKY
jgi:hypothetical protein